MANLRDWIVQMLAARSSPDLAAGSGRSSFVPPGARKPVSGVATALAGPLMQRDFSSLGSPGAGAPGGGLDLFPPLEPTIRGQEPNMNSTIAAASVGRDWRDPMPDARRLLGPMTGGGVTDNPQIAPFNPEALPAGEELSGAAPPWADPSLQGFMPGEGGPPGPSQWGGGLGYMAAPPPDLSSMGGLRADPFSAWFNENTEEGYSPVFGAGPIPAEHSFEGLPGPHMDDAAMAEGDAMRLSRGRQDLILEAILARLYPQLPPLLQLR